MRFAIAFDDQILAGIAQLKPLEEIAAVGEPEAQAIALRKPVETPATDQTGSSQQASVSGLRIMFSVEIGTADHEKHETDSGADERHS